MEKFNNNKIEFKININLIISILVIIAILLTFGYFKIIKKRISISKFANESETFVNNNEKPIFKIDKIVLYSSASAVDNSTGEVLQDLDISQYTDISIDIDNKLRNSDITTENTVKKLYIDNINIDINSSQDNKIFNYKNPYIIGKFKVLSQCENNKIDFKIVNTNDENNIANYDEPTFFTDCSNPLTLGYINKDLVKGYGVSEDENSVSFDGKILKTAGIGIDDLNCRITFQVHIINYENQEFVCPIAIDNNLDNDKEEIYSGYVLKVQNTDSDEYNFIELN